MHCRPLSPFISTVKKTLEELFENYSGEYIAEETDRGDDVGKEKWYEMNIT